MQFGVGETATTVTSAVEDSCALRQKKPGAVAGLSERSKIPRACACRSSGAYFAAICELWPARSFQVLFCRRNVSVEITVLD